MNIPDQFRAAQFINEIQEKYVKGGEAFPRFIYIHLPNEHMTEPRPQDGYPYEASYVADNDYALGRIVEYLSSTPWWREMAIFVTAGGTTLTRIARCSWGSGRISNATMSRM